MSRVGAAWNFSWSGQTGQTYQLQSSASLCPAAWTNMGNPFTAASPAPCASDASPAAAQRFYRLLVLP
jgi:hypothetical protein